MKRTILIFTLLLAVFSMSAQPVKFRFTSNSRDVIPNYGYSKAETNISALLTEINNAYSANRTLRLGDIAIHQVAAQRLNMLWNNLHMTCEDSQYIENCLEDMNGFEVRNIGVKVVGSDYKDSPFRELVVTFDHSGLITDVHLAMEDNQVYSTLRNGVDVEDTRMRTEILKFVEDFRSFYEEKNINALNDIFSEDALIITGYVMHRTTEMDGVVRTNDKVRYRKYDKEQYLNHIRDIFKKNEAIDVSFDDITIVRNGASGKEKYYGVTLKQTWQNYLSGGKKGYGDEGYVFLLWDFRDEQHPKIHVRTWQPTDYVTKEQVFDMQDFFIP